MNTSDSSPDSLLETTDTSTTSTAGPTLKDYAVVVSALTLFSIGLFIVCNRNAGIDIDADSLLLPLATLVGLIGFVWIVMLVFRNYAILRKITSGVYYQSYNEDHPPDWVERPARTFNNLMQLPQLFFLACILMMITGYVDRAQWMLVWIFVATRYAHAAIYMVWNHVPSRFGCYTAGAITLFVIYFRMADQLWT